MLACALGVLGAIVPAAARQPGTGHLEVQEVALAGRGRAAAGIGWAPTKTVLVSAELLYIDNAGADSLGLHTQLKTSFGND